MSIDKNFNELDYKKIGKRIRAQREVMGISREELADEIDISTKFLVGIENGEKGMSIQTLYKISQHLNISADFLVESSSSYFADEARECSLLRERILAQISNCNTKQLRCLAKIVRYYVEAISQQTYDDTCEDNEYNDGEYKGAEHDASEYEEDDKKRKNLKDDNL